ncbi:hypothetical protein GCM10011380_36210 [Sphingomonas metalli]|uniref:SRPBCC domain-containing protein n=1 Tax=Sphingomonas metalli TaxID=1779358 RepID=A0A916WYE8_9SPHN|nr:SRPBCC family protein [Sphingomonas metalli]GGB43523.1 hypothetical protein GCM10011380_36210 [Sphingomonas metalli]
MKEETTFDFNMSALRVWSLISDLKGFARWHPVYRIAGEAERGAEMDVTCRLFGGDRKMTTTMVVNRLAKPELIGWQIGVRGFLTLDERYEIKPIANGVRIHHSIDCRGMVGALLGPLMRQGLRRNMRQQDAAFLNLLRRQSRRSGTSTRHHRRSIKPPARDAAND